MNNLKLPLETEDIKKIIPQRFPFLMIDRVIEASVDRVTAIKNTTVSEQFYKGHFPNEQVMPGVLLIEAMAQAGIVLYKQKFNNDKILYLVSVKARFFEPVFPGDQLKIIATPIKLLTKIGYEKIEVYVLDKKVAECELAFGSQDAKMV